MKKFIFILTTALLLSNAAKADCVCACVNGRTEAICTGPLNIKPVCAPQICPN